ncbi:MAG TPA: universal stress protein [Usitatibacter sp.]|nr:universal stress protein [Usitatibacter sp.]
MGRVQARILPSGAVMLKLLVATDGSDNAMRAVQHVAALARRGIAVHAVLCNVQPPVMSGEVGAVAPMEIAEARRTRAAEAAFAAGTAVLEAAGVEVTLHEAEGDAAREILSAAATHRCDGIVVGRRGMGAVASLVAGSVSSQVIRRSTLPVTLVK